MVIVIWELIFAGAIGGIARAAYGALKAAESGKKVSLWYYFVTIITAAVLGGIVGAIFNSGNTVSALVGYVGSDIIDNVVTGVMPKSLGF